MQCFQKDHNLRVSARKLLKHPWIVAATRSGSVPKKSTEYEEAVKSVQQWNEALKSPNASLRKPSRQTAASPIPPPRKERPAPIATPARSNLSLAKTRSIAEQFRSPDGISDDNWDDDFASAIAPGALQLPHLKPQDQFGGLLSAEKLKAFASFETVTEETNWDDEFEGDLTVKSSMRTNPADSVKTVRPVTNERKKASERKPMSPAKSPKRRAVQSTRAQSTPRSTPPVKSTKPELPSQLRPTSLYREDSVEDYSDLVLANDGAFDSRLSLNQVSRPRYFWAAPTKMNAEAGGPFTQAFSPIRYDKLTINNATSYAVG